MPRRFLFSATLLLTLTSIATVALSQSEHTVVISELLWAGSDTSTADEWIELYNVSSSSIDLSGWRLTKLSSNEETDMLTIPESSSIEPGKTFLIANYSASSEKSRLAIEPDLVDTKVSLSNTKLLIKLYDAAGNLMDTVDDGVGVPFAGDNPSGGTKASMERIEMSASGEDKTNWKTAETSENLDAGALVLGTPGIVGGGEGEESEEEEESNDPPSESDPEPDDENEGSDGSLPSDDEEENKDETPSTDPPAESDPELKPEPTEPDDSQNPPKDDDWQSSLPHIRLTEVLANPVGSDDFEWVEIGNLGTETMDLSGWILTDEQKTYTIPDLTLTPGQHHAFTNEETRVSLNNNGETIVLKIGSQTIDTLPYPKAQEGKSYGINPENPDQYQTFCVPTKGSPNAVIASDPSIVIQSGSAEGPAPLKLNLNTDIVDGSTAGATCSWDFGDGKTSDSCNPSSHTFKEPGTYEVVLNFTDACEQKTERRLTVHVTESASDDAPNHTTPTTGRTSCEVKTYEGITINAALPNPDGDDKAGEWIELKSSLPLATSLCGWALDDEAGGSSAFPLDEEEIPGNGFLKLPRDRTKLILTNTYDEARLLNPNGKLVSMISWTDAASGRVYELHTPGEREDVDVVRVIDGDTIVVRFDNESEETVRLIGVDTPETVHPRKPVEEFGKEASDFTKATLEGKRVTLEYDEEKYDTYDRLLAYVYLDDGTNFNATLIEEGYGYAYLRFPFSRSAEFAQLEANARSAGRGLWANEVVTEVIEEIIQTIFEEIGEETAESEESKDTEELLSAGTGKTITTSGSLLDTIVYELNVEFSEVVSNPIKDDPLGEYIELFNHSDTETNLSGWILDDNPNGSSKPQTLDDFIIASHSYALLCDGEECDHPLKISLNNDGEELSLTSPDGLVSTSMAYPKMKRGEAYVYESRSQAWLVSALATPGNPNHVRRGAALRHPGRAMNTINRDATHANTGRANGAPLQTADVLSRLKKRYRNIYSFESCHPEQGAECNEATRRRAEPPLPPLLAALIPQQYDPNLPPQLVVTGDSKKQEVPWKESGVAFLMATNLMGAAFAKTKKHS